MNDREAEGRRPRPERRAMRPDRAQGNGHPGEQDDRIAATVPLIREASDPAEKYGAWGILVTSDMLPIMLAGVISTSCKACNPL